MPDPLLESDLIFPSEPSISQTLSALKREGLSLTNRLHSIALDAGFVSAVAAAYRLPVIANERCGSWYIRPELKVGSAYFKSTDGHHGQWGLSLRRLNLQVLDVIASGPSGCIIVDSTRRGKSMPDALSKTVPIWIAVLNRLLFANAAEDHVLSTPLDVVSRSEHAQIEGRLPALVEQLKGLRLDVDGLRSRLGRKPLRPTWVTPDTILPMSPPETSDANLVVLCTASGRASTAQQSDSSYVQGAGDDSESWALGLDAVSFWEHSPQLLAATEGELPALIQLTMAASQSTQLIRPPILIAPTKLLYVANHAAAVAECLNFDMVVSCDRDPDPAITEKLGSKYLNLPCEAGKVGSRKLRAHLPKLIEVENILRRNPTSKVLITGGSGKDLAVGVALALLCTSFSEDGDVASPDQRLLLSKATIKHRLSWIMVSMPDAAPSRATLQSVNAHLLG